jgi:hypothetical protein
MSTIAVIKGPFGGYFSIAAGSTTIISAKKGGPAVSGPAQDDMTLFCEGN